MKSIRRMMMVGTVAFAITISSAIWSQPASANLSLSFRDLEDCKMLHTKYEYPEQEELHHILGFDSDEELHEATYIHESLAKIAQIQQVDVKRIIQLQSSQLMDQMDVRLANGQLTLQEYSALTVEVPEIIRKSVYGE